MTRTCRQRAGDRAFFAAAYALVAVADVVDLLLGLADLPGRLRPGRLCHCAHGREAHPHLRAGTDCALCECREFRRAPLKTI